MYDINVYNVHFIQGVFGKPVFTHYEANIGFNGVDTSGTLIMKYPGYIAVCTGKRWCIPQWNHDSRNKKDILVWILDLESFKI